MLPITKTHWLHFLMFILQKRAFLSNHKTLKFSFTIITTEPILGHLCLIKCNGGDHVYTMFFVLLHKRWRNQGCFALYGTNHKHHFISVRVYLQLFVGVRMSCLCCVCLRMLVSNTYCVFLRLLYPMLPVSLDFPFFDCLFGILYRLCIHSSLSMILDHDSTGTNCIIEHTTRLDVIKYGLMHLF